MGQAQMFPMTEEERLAQLRTRLARDVETRQGKLDAAAAAHADAQEASSEAVATLEAFDALVAERAAHLAQETQDAEPETEVVAAGDEPACLTDVELIGEYRALRDRFAVSDDVVADEGDRFDALITELNNRWPSWSEARLDSVLRDETPAEKVKVDEKLLAMTDGEVISAYLKAEKVGPIARFGGELQRRGYDPIDRDELARLLADVTEES